MTKTAAKSKPEVFCPYCGAEAVLLPDAAVYRSTYGGMVYVCIACKAWVGCHRRRDGLPGNVPLGRLADAELRKLKIEGHSLFDNLCRSAITHRGWKKGKARAYAYKWLSAQTGIPAKECHFGMMDNDQCKKAIQTLREFYREIKGNKANGTTR